MLIEDARAKVNLTLRVVGRRVDGYHDLESVVAFADCADRLSLVPGSELRLATTGPLAQACGESADNLVLKAAELLAARVPGLKLGDFVLDKVLPVAAGILDALPVTSPARPPRVRQPAAATSRSTSLSDQATPSAVQIQRSAHAPVRRFGRHASPSTADAQSES